LSVPYALYAKTSESAADAVKITGNQTISGNKTFSGTTTVITPVNANDAANKAYVDAVMKQIAPESGAGQRCIFQVAGNEQPAIY
jgi:hypothetical protein